ncbi:hypothetical protein AJ78_05274 [Emergomyces pasteurianus Ep9510]|uniref:Uncharacterized protein n=1 Tax=Emergomyces pasteurianus Ep9510 TaxID=1447872 RepID=A0A1J9PCX3_9EURO|nr:hypothetical protein AJ78_05274 [Emergomyces pasteurianus Ep9510]
MAPTAGHHIRPGPAIQFRLLGMSAAMKVSSWMITAYNSRSNGRIERINLTVEVILRTLFMFFIVILQAIFHSFDNLNTANQSTRATTAATLAPPVLADIGMTAPENEEKALTGQHRADPELQSAF